MSASLAIEGGEPVRRKMLPVHRPSLGNTEEQLVLKALREQSLSGNGVYSRQLSKRLGQLLQTSGVFPTPSCTAALELAMLSLEIQPGDEVIMPSFSFVSTANAPVLRGARPVFIDIDPRTFNLDDSQLEDCITERTRAIIPVHYGGMPCAMENINRIAQGRGIAVVEDSAHAIGSRYRGKPLGAWGDFGAFSFHGTKNLVCGEGGALAVNRPEWLEAVEISWEKGTNRSAFFRGEVDKYRWVRPGSSYLLADLLAALMLGQLEKLEWITQRRHEIAQRYLEDLRDLSDYVQLPCVPEGAEPNWHLFTILVSPQARNWTLQALQAEGIQATFHFVPLHTSPYAMEHLGTRPGELPVTERVADSLIRLPIFADMTAQDVQDVINAVHKVISSESFLSRL